MEQFYSPIDTQDQESKLQPMMEIMTAITSAASTLGSVLRL